MPTLTKETIKGLKTAILASAISTGLIALILLVHDITVFRLESSYVQVFFAFPSGAIGASAYIWLAAKLSILGRVTRTNLIATLKALVIVAPLATVLSLISIALGAPHDAQIWIFLVIVLSCVISDVAHVHRATR